MRWREVPERKILLLVSLVFLAGLTLLSWIVLSVLRGVPFAAAFTGGIAMKRQVARGALAGAAASALVLPLVDRLRILRPLRDFSREILGDLRFGTLEILLIAGMAGWSEELFFRGALQPVLGILPTAVLFVLAHGLVHLRPSGRAQFAGFVFLAGLGLGWLARDSGLVAAMVAHAVFDAVNLRLSRETLFRDAPPRTARRFGTCSDRGGPEEVERGGPRARP